MSSTVTFLFGNPNDEPIAGHWSPGASHDGTGVFRSANGLEFLSNQLSPKTADYSMLFGNPGDYPVVGDWIGAGTDSLGLYRPGTQAGDQTVYLVLNEMCNCTLYSDYSFAFPSNNNVTIPVAGDWFGVGSSSIGFFDQTSANFTLQLVLNVESQNWSFGPFGKPGDLPVAGQWTGVCASLPGNGALSTGGQRCNLSLPTATPSVTITPTATLTPGPTATPYTTSCIVQVSTGMTLNVFNTAIDAAIYQTPVGTATSGTILYVYSRSDLYQNLVSFSVTNGQGPIYWTDSSSGLSAMPGSNCSNLPTDVTTRVANPQPLAKPTFSQYPLRIPDPATAEEYQFALAKTYYGLTGGLHPGFDYFTGSVKNNTVNPNLPVVSVADGLVIGYCDPSLTPAISYITGAAWIGEASPTDCDANKNVYNRGFVVVQYGNVVALYAHLNSKLRIGTISQKNNNTPVAIVQDQLIGSTSPSDPEGPHLHFETRTFGANNFDLSKGNHPLIFVDPWQFFNQTVQSWMNDNIANRLNDDGTAIPGWDGQYNAGTQRTQCFQAPANPPPNAVGSDGSTPPPQSSGARTWGYDTNGNPTNGRFIWINGSTIEIFEIPSAVENWQQLCIPGS